MLWVICLERIIESFEHFYVASFPMWDIVTHSLIYVKSPGKPIYCLKCLVVLGEEFEMVSFILIFFLTNQVVGVFS